MPEKHIALAVSLAKILFSTREQFAGAIRNATVARIKASPARSIYAGHGGIPRRAIEEHVDDALYAIGRDGSTGSKTAFELLSMRSCARRWMRRGKSQAPSSDPR